ncbi:DNA-binding response regulator [Bacillus cereus]|nr:accessory protein regulator A [Bacillus cereus AH1272]EEL90666.1 accessory protein regulator A [Bacillus cereus AH1273]PEW87686.1 DNA-binding response regulator [Bacillus cereus]PFN72795.1 DNA-binding response regulator [Bacillus cereus]GCF75371.1 accessory gene regulator protein A [Bacillus cereus]
MKIIICEDDMSQLKRMRTIIENFAMMEDNGMQVVLATNNPDEVIAYLEKDHADCYFLDIDLKHEITGIVLGDIIRKQDPLCNIIIVTTHAEMTYLTFMYKISALDFIIKDRTDMLKERVISTLQEAYRRYIQIGESQAVTKKLQIKSNGRTRNIDVEEIYFFEASPTLHKVILHLENEHIEFYGRLKDYEQSHEKLYRCHKAFIVNRNKIESVDVKERIVYLTNGETCLASARLIKGLLK